VAYYTDQQTIGGLAGHLLRRIIHISMCLYPWLYYYHGEHVYRYFHLSSNALLIILVLLIVVLDVFRFKKNIVIFGQRRHEDHHLGSFAWAAIAIGLVLMFAPGKAYGFPIIWSCAFVDPLLGELRRFYVPSAWTFVIGMLLVFCVWILCTALFGTPWWWAVIMAPVIALLEKPNLRWIDDNALMQLGPLFLILLFA